MNIKTTTVWVVRDGREVEKGQGLYLRVLDDGLLQHTNTWLVFFGKKDCAELVSSKHVYINEDTAKTVFDRERENQIQWHQQRITHHTEKLSELQKA